MADKTFFIDTTKCTACRGCQIACKQWNKLPATETHNWGSYQNPADLSFDTFKLVRYSEVVSGGKLNWFSSRTSAAIVSSHLARTRPKATWKGRS